LLDLPATPALIQKAGRKADVVIVYMHPGAEGSDATHVTGSEEVYAGEDRGNPRAFAHAAVDAGAGRPTPDASHAGVGMIARLSRADFGRRAARISARGIISPPG
jgi:hypothetical protein